MRRISCWLGTVIVLAGAASLAHAQYPAYPCCPPPQAPDACGPGYYNSGPYGMMYGPNYWVTPPFLPFNGLMPNPGFRGNGPPAPPAFPSAPYYRGPRDFFMYEESR